MPQTRVGVAAVGVTAASIVSLVGGAHPLLVLGAALVAPTHLLARALKRREARGLLPRHTLALAARLVFYACLGCAVAMPFVADSSLSVWGAAGFLACTPYAFLASHWLFNARRAWQRVRVDAQGLHGECAAVPRHEHIPWSELDSLRAAVVREGSALMDENSFMPSVLALSERSPSERNRLLAAEDPAALPTVDHDALRADVYVYNKPGGVVGGLVSTAIVYAVCVVIPAVVAGASPDDPRIWGMVAGLAPIRWRVIRARQVSWIDRRYGLLVTQVSRVWKTIRPYEAARDVSYSSIEVVNEVLVSSNGRSIVTDRGQRLYVETNQEEAAASYAAVLNAFLDGGPVPDGPLATLRPPASDEQPNVTGP